MPFGGYHGAMAHVMATLYTWPLLMRERAPVGQDFLLQLPTGLGELPPTLTDLWLTASDAEAHVAMAIEAKERGNVAFVAGDTSGALREYMSGIHHLRPLVGLHMQRNGPAIIHAAMARSATEIAAHDTAAAVSQSQAWLWPLIRIQMFPYVGQRLAADISVLATIVLCQTTPLPPAARLPGCNDMASLVGRFWRQLTSRFMQQGGADGGPVVSSDAWAHDKPTFFTTLHPLDCQMNPLFANTTDGCGEQPCMQ
jgi:hypothetical protein